MAKSRLAVALVAFVLSSAAPPSAAVAADVCQNPTFRISQGAPSLPQNTQPTALSAGTYIARPGTQPGAGCGCDLAIGLKSGPAQGSLALFHGNDDGTFSPDSLRPLDGVPVAIATGRFRMDAAVEVIVVVTSTPSGNGKVQVFAPDATGAYPQSPTATFPVGANPVAITTGDFDGDGLLDAAVINQDNSSLSILFGDGTGSFVPNVFTVGNLGATPKSLTAGKFSGTSGADDIAIAVHVNASGATQVGIVIVPGSSARAFAPKPAITVGARGSSEPWIAAANLSGPSEGAAGRRWRDLAIAFTDRNQSGTVGRVKVLLGRDGGGFGDVNAAKALDLGADHPRSVKVVDIDGDGVVDLIVSTYGDLTSQSDGTIRPFQGQAAPAAGVGFQVNPRWPTIPATTAIRPRALVAGPFGNHLGLAAINAPDINTITVFLGNGQGAFTQPSLVTTPIGDDDHLFVSGDFHSGNGSSPLQDLAFITKLNGENVLRILQADGAGGFAPADPTQPVLLAGNSPSHIAVGQFVPQGATGVAIIDDTGAAGQQPLLKIFLGQGNGAMTAGTELTLAGIGQPRAMVTGYFRSPDMLDIAVVSDTTPQNSTAFSGQLTLLFNKGQGVFSPGTSMPLAFAPGALAASSRLRPITPANPIAKTDLLIRDANANRFLFLVNIDNGFFRPAIGQPQGFFTGAGDVNSLLVGNVAHPGANLDDVVTFDHDMTLKVFVNNGPSESFSVRPSAPGNDPHFVGAQASYLLADFGSGTLGLAAPIIRAGGQLGLLLLQGDGTGGFTPATGDVPLQQPRGTATATAGTNFIQSSSAIPGFVTTDISLRQSAVAQFRSSLQGNGKPDFAVITKASAASRTAGNCPGDMQQPPPPAPLPRDPVCPTPSSFNDCPPHQRPCFEGPCCFCRDNSLPARVRCPTTCDTPPGPAVPFQPVCNTTTTYTPAVSVFANTCGD